MSIKQIYLALSGENEDSAAADAAFALAKNFKAHVIGSDTAAEPGPFLDQTGIGMMATYYDELYKTAEKVQAHKREAAAKVFEAARSKAEVPLAGADGAEPPTCSWHAHDGQADIVAHLGRLADLIVLARPGENTSVAELRALEQALFDARRPVLMMPAETGLDLTVPAVIAWNGSGEAARSIINAVDLLGSSTDIAVVQVGDLAAGALASEEAVAYLASHGLKARVNQIAKGDDSVGAALLKEAAGGLLVMGAYTHNPWRELVLGGVTRHMMEHSDRPVLLVH